MNTMVSSALLAFCVLASAVPWAPTTRRRGTVQGQAGRLLRIDKSSEQGTPSVRLGRRSARRRGSSASSAQVGVDVAVLLELLAAASRAGVSVPRALEAVGDAVGGAEGRTLREAGTGLILGASWRAAWDGAADSARLRPVDQALRSSWSNGSAPGPALTAAGDQLRRDSARRARTAAGQLGVRLVVPLGACFLPAFILLGLLPVFVSLGTGLLAG